MAPDRAFLLPVAVDDVPDDHETVPERFREVQWTRLPGGVAPPEFLVRVRRLLANDASSTAHTAETAASPARVSAATPAAPTPRAPESSRVTRVALAVLALTVAYFAFDKIVIHFKVQDEIAGAVASALKLKLAATQRTGARGTTNPDAYNEYLIGLQNFNLDNAPGYARAVTAFEKATTLDPAYAAACAQFALAPDDGQGPSARGVLRAVVRSDPAGALQDLDRALQLEPGEAVHYHQGAMMLLASGRATDAERELKTCVELDPLSKCCEGLVRTQIASPGRDLNAARG
jgi:tetratricopeptide (TPR) repeat protein